MLSRKMRLTSLMVCTTLMVTLFAGCGKNDSNAVKPEESKQTSESSEQKNPYEEKFEISWVGLNGAEIQEGNWVQKKLEEKFNVKLVNTKINVLDKERSNLMINSGEMPDAAHLYSLAATDLYKQGVTRTIPKSLLEKYAPAYCQMLKDNPPGELLNLQPDVQNEYLALTGLSKNLDAMVWWNLFRLDWLEKKNLLPDGFKMEALDDNKKLWMTKESFTYEQLEKILEIFTKGDPDGNSKDDTYGLSGCNNMNFSFVTLMGMHGYNEYNLLNNGEICEWSIAPQHKEFLKMLNKWYKEGWLDPEFPTLNLQKMWEKVTAGKVGLWMSPFNYADPEHPTYQTRPPMSVISKDPNAKILIAPPPYGKDGTRGVKKYAASGGLNYTFFINKKVSDEKLARILQIFDYINFDKEGVVWSHFGEAGTHFDWSGEPYKSIPVMKENVKFGGETGLQYYNFPIYDDHYVQYYMFNKVPAKVYEVSSSEEFKKLIVAPYKWDFFNETNGSEVSKNYKQGLDTIVNEFFYKGIIGDIDIDTGWDAYVNKWKSEGGSKLLDEYKKAPIVEELLKGNRKY